MSQITSENTFEKAIVQSLVETGGFTQGDAGGDNQNRRDSQGTDDEKSICQVE